MECFLSSGCSFFEFADFGVEFFDENDVGVDLFVLEVILLSTDADIFE